MRAAILLHGFLVAASNAVGVSAAVDVSAAIMLPIPLENVRLLPGSRQYQSEFTNVEYMTMLSMDSLLWSFRTTAGINPATISADLPYNGTESWDGPDTKHRGSFAGESA